MEAALSDDLMAPEVIHDPHTYYRELREADPVHWNERWGGWVLTRYADVVPVLRDAERFSSDRMAFLANELSEEERESLEPIFRILSRWMVFSDPPYHTKLRNLLNKPLTPKGVEKYRFVVRGIVEKVLDEIEAKGRMEVVRDLAYQVPMTVILTLMGVPDLDRVRIKEWSEQLGTFFFIRADEPRRREIACEGVTALVDYLTPVIDDRRAHPNGDLISLLTYAEERGDLTSEDVLATCVLLVFGGHETTMNLIANGTLALIRHPQEWDRLRQDPALIGTAVEELLRYDGSVKATVRWAKESVDIGDRHMQQGERILVGLSAANRDPDQFQEPDRLDVARDPNPHVAFAHGIHVCLGASLARMEAQEAFSALTRRLPCPTLETDELEYHRTVVSRALRAMPVKW
ncbi:MAG: cytochrome P450 [Acidimicrobiia bacterium]